MTDTTKGVLVGAALATAFIAVYARLVLPSAVDSAVRREVSLQFDSTRGTFLGSLLQSQRNELEPIVGNMASRVARDAIAKSLPF